MTLGEKATTGTVILIIRRFALQAIRFIGAIIIARILQPEIFGVFGIAFFVVNFFQMIGEVGLSAALIQMEGVPGKVEYRTAFTIQFLVSILIGSGLILLAPMISTFYNEIPGLTNFIRALSVSLVVTSFRVIPSVQLERELDFGKLVIPEIVEVVTYQGVAIALAYFGYGVWALVWALISRSFIGVIVINIISPWQFGFSISKTEAKAILNFGIPYQFQNILGYITISVVPILIGKILGPVAVGYITWAYGLANKPMEIMEIANRIAFPVFSRIQKETERIGSWLGKSTELACSVVFPISTMIIILGKPLVNFIYTDKWLPGINVLYALSLNAIVNSTIIVAITALQSIGEVKYIVKLRLIWAGLLWLLTGILIHQFGATGYGISFLLVNLLTLPLPFIRLSKLHINVPFLSTLYLPIVLSAIVGIGGIILLPFSQKSIFSFSLTASILALIWISVLFILRRRLWIRFSKSLLSSVKVVGFLNKIQ